MDVWYDYENEQELLKQKLSEQELSEQKFWEQEISEQELSEQHLSEQQLLDCLFIEMLQWTNFVKILTKIFYENKTWSIIDEHKQLKQVIWLIKINIY